MPPRTRWGKFLSRLREGLAAGVRRVARSLSPRSAGSYAQLEQLVAERTKELAALNAIATVVSQSMDLDAVLKDAVDKTLQVMESEAAGIYLLDDETGMLDVVVQRGLSPELVAAVSQLKVGEGFSGRVVQSGQPLVVRDISADPRLTRMAVREEGLRSLATVPLSSKGKVLGTLYAVTRGYREFTDHDVQLLTSIGHQIGVAIESARFFDAEQRRAEQFRVINEVGRHITSILAVDELLEQIVRLVRETLGYYQSAIGLIEGDELIFRTAAGFYWEALESEPLRLKVGEEGITGLAVKTGEPVLTPDVSQEPRYRHVPGDTKTKSELAVPLKTKEAIIGALAVGSDRPDDFDETDLVVLQSLAHQAAMAIDNARLFEAERRRRQEATLLAEMAKLISGTLNLDEILRLTAEYAVDVFDVHCCCVLLCSEGSGNLKLAIQIGLDDQAAVVITGVEFVPSEALRRTVFDCLEPLIIEDVPADPHLSPQDLLDLQSALVVPIEVGGQRLGALQLSTHQPKRRCFTAGEGKLAMAMANQAAVAIQNARFFDAEQRRAEQFRVISEVGRKITSILAVGELLDQMARLIQMAFEYYLVEIGLVEGDELVFKTQAGRDLDSPFEGFCLKMDRQSITGWVAVTGESLLVPDVSCEPRYVQATPTVTRSELAVPIKLKESVIGVLNVESDQLDTFDESDVIVLQSLANQAAVAIENARFFESEQRRAEQFRVISEVGRRITSILDINEVLAQVVRLIRKAFGYDHVAIAMVEGDEAVYKVGAGHLWDDPQFRFLPGRLKVGQEGITGWVAATGEHLLVPDVAQDPRYVVMQGSSTRSELAVPIKVKGEVIGVLDAQSERLNGFDESDLVVLQSLANQTGIAIENARLYERAQQAAALEERNRLARDLHDAVTQTLFSASLVAEVLPDLWEKDQDKGREYLKELRLMSRGALAEMRTLLLELRPTTLVEMNLSDLLRQLSDAVTGQTGIPVTVVVEGLPDFPADVHVALYRIAQEALNNVVKHARANQVTVRLRCAVSAGVKDEGPPQAGRVELCVSDDGGGFDPSAVSPQHLGLSIMRERAEAIGAQLQIESEVGHGTQVRVVWVDDEERNAL